MIDHEGERLSVSQGVGVVSIAGIDASEYRYEGIQESLVNMFEECYSLTWLSDKRSISLTLQEFLVTRQGGEVVQPP